MDNMNFQIACPNPISLGISFYIVFKISIFDEVSYVVKRNFNISYIDGDIIRVSKDRNGAV